MVAWTHSDLSLAARAESGVLRARTEQWSQGPLNDRAADLRAYMLANAAAQADLVGTTTSGAGTVTIDTRAGAGIDALRAQVAAAMAGTWTALSGGRVYSDKTLTTMAATHAGSDAGALPAAAVVAIVIGTAATTAYVAYQAADVVDRQLSRIGRAKQLIQADETLRRLVADHTDEERRQNKLLPLSSATAQALDMLKQRQAELVKEQPKPDPSTPLTTAVKWGLAAVAAIVVWTELRRPAGTH